MRSLLALSAVLAPVQASVLHEDVTVGGYVCGRYQTARVFYPETEGKYPVISFAHGYNNDGVDAYACYQKMLDEVVGAGYVVVALMSSNLPWECDKEWQDQLRSLDWVRGRGNDATSSSVSSTLKSRMDLTLQTGLFGHSMGGGATYHAAADSDGVNNNNVGAAVALNPQVEAPIHLYSRSNSLVPIFFGSGSHDRVVYNWDVKKCYRKTSGVSKAWVDIRGAGHFEPQTFCGGTKRKDEHTMNRHTPYAINFFNCHLKGVEGDCKIIYGQQPGSVCNGPIEMKHCETQRVTASNSTVEVNSMVDANSTADAIQV